MTHYLRFPDEATGMAALTEAGFTDADGTVLTASHTHVLDVVGVITIGGEYDPESGDVLMPPTVLDGWHVNYIGELPEGWADYAVSPEQPVRVFAS
jgi:hypothetical protein